MVGETELKMVNSIIKRKNFLVATALLMIASYSNAQTVQIAKDLRTFQGSCKVINFDTGAEQIIGSFALSHQEALAGKCPHVFLDFETLNPQLELAKYQMYIEHQVYGDQNQNDYAGIYLLQNDQYVFSSFNLKDVSKAKLVLGASISEKSHIECTGELK